MNEHPILFKGPMVRAILEGRKTQTRRLISQHNSLRNGSPWYKKMYPIDGHDWANAFVDEGPSPAGNAGPYLHVPYPFDDNVVRIYPKVQAGDWLWVRETFCVTEDSFSYAFRADNWTECPSEDGKWTPSIFCTRQASRITLEVLKIRVERLQDISEADAVAEGVDAIQTRELGSDNVIRPLTISAKSNYRSLWIHINDVGSWEANPWVWVYEFRRVAQ